MKLAYIYIVLFLSSVCFAQTPVLDSLRNEIAVMEKSDNIRKARDTAYINILNKFAWENFFVNKDSTYHYAKKALDLSESANYTSGIMKSLLSLGYYHSEMGNYDEAIKYFLSALKRAKSSGDAHSELGALYYLSSTYSYKGDLKKSIDYALTSINKGQDLLEKESNSRLKNKNPEAIRKIQYLLSLCYESLGKCLRDLNQNEESLSYLLLADELNKIVGNELSSAQTQSNIGELYSILGRYDKALEYLDQSIPVFNAYDKKDWLAFAYRVKGDAYTHQNEFEKALETYAAAQHIHQQIQDKRELVLLYEGLSRAYYGKQDLENAENFAALGLNTAREINSFEGAKNTTGLLYSINKAKGDIENALNYHEIFKAYNDSIFNNENSKSLWALEAQMEFQKKESELILEKEKAVNKQRMLIYFSSAGVLILLTILFLTQRNRQLERKLNSLLAMKNKVLQLRELQLKHSDQSKNKLFSIISHDLRTPVGSLNGLLDLLKDQQIEAEDFIRLAPQLSEQVKNVSFTLNNLLQWSQQQMNGTRSRPSKNNLFLLTNEGIDLFRDQVVNKEITMENNIPDDAFILGDPNQIAIVIRNLINNAIKFTPKHGNISVFAIESEGYWQFEIRDTGVGIPESKVQRIMSKESFIDSSYGTENEKGTGIGLNICKEMITLNGGEFWVKSKIGVGTSFFFTLKKYQEEMQQVS